MCSNDDQRVSPDLAGVLIPSSSGHVFEQQLVAEEVADGGVLIPSSSGHVFEPHPPAMVRKPESLNPFFIRACVRTLPAANFRLPAWVLIPSSSGHVFELPAGRSDARHCVLIPSSSGHVFEHHPLLQAFLADLGLNPFFIRACVRTARLTSFSPAIRLNPFFIRACVRTCAGV